MIWFTVEEAEEVQVSLEALRFCDPQTRMVLLALEDLDSPDEFLESWR